MSPAKPPNFATSSWKKSLPVVSNGNGMFYMKCKNIFRHHYRFSLSSNILHVLITFVTRFCYLFQSLSFLGHTSAQAHPPDVHV